MELEEALKKVEELTEALSGANSEAANRRKTASELKEQLAAFDGIDPVEFKALQDKAALLESDKLKAAGKYDEALAEAMKGRDGEIDSLKTMLQGKDGTLAKVLIDNALLSAIDGKAVNNAQVLALIRGNIKLEEDKPVVYNGDAHKLNDKGEKMSVSEYAAAFLAENPHLVKASGGGSGSQGNSGNNNQGGKSINREAFNALDSIAQAAYCKDGGIITD